MEAFKFGVTVALISIAIEVPIIYFRAKKGKKE